VLLGAVAPEPIGDKSLRSKEEITKVENPYYYTTKTGDGETFFGPSNYFGDLLKKQSYFQIDTSSSIPPATSGTIKLPAFRRLQQVSLTYNWYVSTTSSGGSGEIICRNPTATYPGTRFNDKITCANWCAQNKGTWFAKEKGCYSNQAQTPTKGCCRAYYALESVNLRVKKISKESDGRYVLAKGGLSSKEGATVSAQNDEGGCTYDYLSSNLPTSSSSSSLSKQGMSAFSYSLISLSPPSNQMFPESQVSGTYHVPNYKVNDFSIVIRHEEDPFIGASLITKGCSSCSNDAAPTYPRGTCTEDTSHQCFGLTPEQKRHMALIFFGLGALFLVFPCGFYHCLIKPALSRKRVNHPDYMEKLNQDQSQQYAPAPGFVQPVQQAIPQAQAYYPQAQVAQQVAQPSAPPMAQSQPGFNDGV
jgi:hypothetical protein